MGEIIFWVIIVFIIAMIGLPMFIGIISVIIGLLGVALAYLIYLVPFLGFFILWRIIFEIIRRG